MSGTKLRGIELRLSAVVRPRGTTQLLVRANAQYKPYSKAPAVPVDQPEPCQDFFAALAQSLLLDAPQVD